MFDHHDTLARLTTVVVYGLALTNGHERVKECVDPVFRSLIAARRLALSIAGRAYATLLVSLCTCCPERNTDISGALAHRESLAAGPLGF